MYHYALLWHIAANSLKTAKKTVEKGCLSYLLYIKKGKK